ncbi:MAG: gamma-glutamyl-gamma-aminobutyrate hydrolase family protein, partial [Acidobacteria bacterium]|nr:gamma-glutamyl-gamma-aminobutyrate hydrolase family protein [Acidobacteriota bacterium]
MSDAVGLIVMGGPMGVYDRARYPFLVDEMRLMEQALQARKPVLGVCLGSQLLAATLGGAVTRGKRKEIGWHAVTLTESGRTDRLWTGVKPSFMGYHWHGDVFQLPAGAVSLASSVLTECQAFRYGHNAYGFLFHLEVTEEIIEDMVRTFADELREAGMDGREMVAEGRNYLPDLHRIGGLVFQRWASLAEKL